MARLLSLLAGAWLLGAAVASAQSDAPAPATRADALEAQREARERSLGTDPHNWLERTLFFVEDKHVIERLNPPEGAYPRLGSVTNGSGFGLGAGYRERTAGDRLLLDASGSWTYRDYKTIQARVVLRPVPTRPVELSAGSVWYDYTQEDFFGLGPASNRSDRVDYRLEGLDTYAQLQARKAGWLVLRGRIGRQRTNVTAGTDPRFPTLATRFDEATAPGMSDPLTLFYAQTSAGIDTRDQPGNTRSGGLYDVTAALYRDRRGDHFDFTRLDLRALHVFPIFDKKRGFAVRAAASRIDPDGASLVPFYLMPTIGGSDSIRSFRDFRFRDATSVNFNAEYRWEAFSGLDLALFVDAGDVGPSWHALVGDRLRTAWGGGFRFNTNRRVFLRIDIADGREGLRLWVKFGPVFAR
ncbi:MAG: BamA/TamA family outer membrane protein [Acidobacteriota bacterium]